MATATRTTRIEETYRSLAHGDASLRYFVGRGGDHVVSLGYFNDLPNLYRFAAVEEAREAWKSIRARLAGEGYTRRTR